MKYAERMELVLYDAHSIFTPEEQAAMRRGYTLAERKALSGQVFGVYPQAISEEHAGKLDAINTQAATW